MIKRPPPETKSKSSPAKRRVLDLVRELLSVLLAGGGALRPASHRTLALQVRVASLGVSYMSVKRQQADPTQSQAGGYYISREENLLRDFDSTLRLMEETLLARYGEEFTLTLREAVRREYQKLIPEIPYIKGPRGRPLNTFLLITAQELAAYKALKHLGKPAAEAWELCHRALRLRTERIPRWKRWLTRRLMFSSLVKRVFAWRARKKTKVRLGEFEVEYLVGDGKDFDLGVNYLQCGNYRFAIEHGGEEFAPYICMSDIALSDAMGWGLTRTQTLADGCQYCDFRFKRGGTTQISSRTPRVQEVIEGIRDREGQPNSRAVG